jgi:outer membrane protein TolC
VICARQFFSAAGAFVALFAVGQTQIALPTQAGANQQSRALTLTATIDAAEQHYPKLRAALEQRNAARAGIGVARTAYLPKADVLWQTNRATANNIYGLLLPQSVIPPISGPVLPSDNSRSAWSSAGGALLSWQPFDFGARAAEVNAARYIAESADAGSALTRLDVAVATANAFLDVVTAEQLAAAAEANAMRREVFANSVRVLVENQLRPGADAAQAEASLAQARTQLIQTRTQIAVRRAILANLTGIPVGDLHLDTAGLLTIPALLPASAAALKSHPAAKQAEATVEQQQARLSFLSRSYAPRFNLQAALSGRGAGTALSGPFPGGSTGLAPSTMNWAAGMQIILPALDFFSLRAQKKVQEANVRAEQARYEQTLDDLSVAVQQAQAELEGAREAAQNTPIELTAAQQSEQQQRARFQSGLATVVDVTAAETLLVQAEADDAVARINVWRALAQLAAAQGDLSPFLAQLQRQP